MSASAAPLQRLRLAPMEGHQMSRNRARVARTLATVAIFATFCSAAQTKVPRPGPLTKDYSGFGVSFRYPNNWIVDDSGPNHITVAPLSAFIKKADRRTFVTHGFFLGFVKDELLSKSTDEVTTLLLEKMHDQGAQAQKSRPQLTHVGNGSCGEMLNTDTPYAGTETQMFCTLRVGDGYISTEMFSPTADWKQYKDVFSRILGAFSAVVVPPPGPLTAEYSLPGVASFRYPNNWIVAGKSEESKDAFPFIRSQHLDVKDDNPDVTIGPSSAFEKAGRYRGWMSHGFEVLLLGITELPISTDKATTLLLESVGDLTDGTQHSQGVEAQKSPPELTHIDNGSCAEAKRRFGHLTEMICTLRLGNANISTFMWCPTAEWNQYRGVFSRIVGTFSAVVSPEPNRGHADTATSRPGVDSSTAASPRVLTGREISQMAFPAMVTLVMQGKNGHTVSLGSGFFVAPRLVATNFHVVKGTTSGIAERIGKKESLSVLGFVAVDAINDLAILEVNDSSSATLSITNSSSVSIGDTIYAIGSPEGFEGTFSQGVVSGVRERRGERLLQISAPISPGSSGGPILDQSARVVGISVLIYREGQNLNFAIPSDYLSKLLAHISALQPLSALPAASQRTRR